LLLASSTTVFLLGKDLLETVEEFLLILVLLGGSVAIDEILEHLIGVISEAMGEGEVEEGLFMNIRDLCNVQSLPLGLAPGLEVSQALNSHQ
jgi:hypothetical protein